MYRLRARLVIPWKLNGTISAYLDAIFLTLGADFFCNQIFPIEIPLKPKHSLKEIGLPRKSI